MRIRSWFYLACLLTAGGFLLLPTVRAALSSPAAAGPVPKAGSLAAVKARGRLVMLCFPHQESPFIRVKVEAGLGHYEGIDHDVMAGFASSLGVALAVQPVKPDFGRLLPELLRGSGDVIASELSITPEREQRLAFSIPYFAVRQLVVVRAASDLHAAADLAGKRASTIRDSSNEKQTRALHPGAVSYAQFTRWSFDAVNEGKADFTVQDEPSVWRLLELYPGLRVAFPLPCTDRYGYAMAPGSDLKPALDSYLEGIRRSGRLEQIIRSYMDEGATSGLPAAGAGLAGSKAPC